MTNQRFYFCKHCGNIIAYAKSSGVPVVCCGEKMQELVPNTTDGAMEKHVPQIKVEGDTVKVTVGSVLHPMGEAHRIEWVSLETEQGNQRKELKVDSAPEVQFALVAGDKVVAAYAYCNLHGLWKNEI